MAVLSAASIDRLRQAIAAGDPDLLRGVSGVGKKTAERLILELRGKLDGGVGGLAPVMDETYQALIALGYTPGQATAAIGQIPDSITGEQERIKAALKGLSS
jgi:Holliday junction DNA helicase RuvA